MNSTIYAKNNQLLLRNEQTVEVCQFRNLSLEIKAIEEENDTIEYSFSSETPYERWWGKESLSHADGAIDLSRLDTMCLLWNHDPDMVLGYVLTAFVENRKGLATAQWSTKEWVQKEVKPDVSKGLLKGISVGYMIHEIIEASEDNYIVTKWEPLEHSIVSIPADYSVGINRKNIPLLFDMKNPTETVNIEAIKQQTRNDELARVKSIHGMIDTHGFKELGQQLIESGASVDESRAAFLSEIGSQPIKPVGVLGQSRSEVRDISGYSLSRAICQIIDNKPLSGLERELHDEIIKRSGYTPQNGGFLVPVHDIPFRNLRNYSPDDPFSLIPKYQNRVNLTTSDASGAYTIATEVMADSFVELRRNASKVMQLGVTRMTGLQGGATIPGQASAGETQWIAENVAGSSTDITFREITATPHTIMGMRQYSDKLLKQATVDVDELLRQDLLAELVLAIDYAAIAGTGTNDQPLGILLTPGVNSVSHGTNGGAPTYFNLIDMCRDIYVSNADVLGEPHWLLNPLVWAKLMKTPLQASGVEGNFIIPPYGEMNANLLGYAYDKTNQIPSNLTKGTGTNLSAIILGIWSQLIYFEWGILEILPNRLADSAYPKLNTLIRAHQHIDFAVRHAGAFSIANDIITT